MTDLDRQIEDILSAPYSRVVIPDAETGTFAARVLEFPGCIAQGTSLEEAYKNLEATARDWLVAALDLGQEIPEPAENQEYRGRILVRLPRSLHRQAVEAAERDVTSLNQFIVAALSEKVGASTAVAQLADKVDDYLDRLWGSSLVISAWHGTSVSKVTVAEPTFEFAFETMSPTGSPMFVVDDDT